VAPSCLTCLQKKPESTCAARNCKRTPTTSLPFPSFGMPIPSRCRMFDDFVVAWNGGRAPASLYASVADAHALRRLEAARPRTSHAWGIALTDGDRARLQAASAAVEDATDTGCAVAPAAAAASSGGSSAGAAAAAVQRDPPAARVPLLQPAASAAAGAPPRAPTAAAAVLVGPSRPPVR